MIRELEARLFAAAVPIDVLNASDDDIARALEMFVAEEGEDAAGVRDDFTDDEIAAHVEEDLLPV